MIDRGIIKWKPFNSCISSIDLIKEIENKKNKKSFPILSEDQLKEMNEFINDAYNLKININIEYFYNDNIKLIKGKINNINYQEKKICINNKYIYYKQIIKIYY